MKLENHIATTFLTHDDFLWTIVEDMHPDFEQASNNDDVANKVADLYYNLNTDQNKNYIITNTVFDKLDMLKVKRTHMEGIGEHFDWTYFRDIPNRKITFILPNNSLLRLNIYTDVIHFTYLKETKSKISPLYNESAWTLFYVNRITGEQCEYSNSPDVKAIEEQMYKLLCFFFLSDNSEVEVKPGAKHGTRKEGKVINTLPFPVTIVDSNWNVTSIRTEGFGVRGHFAIRWTGEGRSVAKMVFIEPYQKEGYVRHAKKDI